MQLHPFSINDLPFLRLLQPEGWHDILPVYTFYHTSPFCFPVKVMLANELVGVGTTVMHNDVAWLAHIIVHAEYRNRGIGKFITQSLIDHIDSRICKTIYLIATPPGEPVYHALGFETETEYVFYKDLALNTNNIASPNIIPYDKKHYEQIQYIDQKVSGEKRMFHFENYLSNAHVYMRDNHVEGYYIPDFHEGLIVATSAEAGTELIKKRFCSKEHAAFPIDNMDAMTYMSLKGFEPFKTARRMRLGEIRDVDYSKIYNRIAGSIG